MAASTLRPRDFAARFGGEEFVTVLPATDHDASLRVAELIRTMIQALGIPHGCSSVSDCLTVCLGIGTIANAPVADLDIFLSPVDAALYKAKRRGRNPIESTQIA